MDLVAMLSRIQNKTGWSNAKVISLLAEFIEEYGALADELEDFLNKTIESEKHS